MELVLYLFKAVFRGWEDSHIHRPYPLSAYENLHTAAISPSRALLQLEANKTKHLEQHEMLSTRRRMQRNDSLLSTRRTSANFYACCCHLHRTGPNPYWLFRFRIRMHPTWDVFMSKMEGYIIELWLYVKKSHRIHIHGTYIFSTHFFYHTSHPTVRKIPWPWILWKWHLKHTRLPWEKNSNGDLGQVKHTSTHGFILPLLKILFRKYRCCHRFILLLLKIFFRKWRCCHRLILPLLNKPTLTHCKVASCNKVQWVLSTQYINPKHL